MGKITERIINAVLYGGSKHFDENGKFTAPASPLYKLPCRYCPTFVAIKDMDNHLAEKHGIKDETNTPHA